MMTRAEARALARAERRAREARMAQERREQMLRNFLDILIIIGIILCFGIAGGIEQGTIHVFGL
jgi:hypothetical protein